MVGSDGKSIVNESTNHKNIKKSKDSSGCLLFGKLFRISFRHSILFI